MKKAEISKLGIILLGLLALILIIIFVVTRFDFLTKNIENSFEKTSDDIDDCIDNPLSCRFNMQGPSNYISINLEDVYAKKSRNFQ